MPMGVAGAPAYCQDVVTDALKDLLGSVGLTPLQGVGFRIVQVYRRSRGGSH